MGWNETLPFKYLVIELIDRRLVKKLGTWRIEDNVSVGGQWIEPFLDIEEKEPSAIRNLSLREEGKYDKNSC